MLKHFIHLTQVFAPILLKDDKWNKKFDPKLQNLLSELEAGLGSVLRKQDPSSGPAASDKDDGFAGMLLKI